VAETRQGHLPYPSQSATHAPDADYELIKAEFTEAEQVNLTLAIGAINVWNRLQVGFRASHPAGPAHNAV
jgi:alkylhydroperoxidase family enzyme